MQNVKRWLAVLLAAALCILVFQILQAEPPPIITTDDHPWDNGGGAAIGPVKTAYSFYLVRLAPTGGFYLVRISLPASGLKETTGTTSLKKPENKSKRAQ